MRDGSLTLVGAGLKFVGHLTLETVGHIEQADKVFLALADPAAVAWIRQLNPSAELLPFYIEEDPGRDSSDEWRQQINAAIDSLLEPVRQGSHVCIVFQGHPGVCLFPAHEAIRCARREGLVANMLPAVSAEDCLFADLGVDPAQQGCQSFEATDLLIRRRPFSTASALIVRQIGLIGEFQLMGRLNLKGLRVLVDFLSESYGRDHPVVVYEAAIYPLASPSIQRIALARVPEARITDYSTLYAPPATTAPLDPQMMSRLGIPLRRVRNG